MALRLTPTLLLATALLAFVPAASAQDPAASAKDSDACGTPVAVTDAAGDQVIYPLVPPPDAVRQAELDVLATSIAIDGAEVVLTATLGAVPSAEPDAYSFRYWFGFHVKPAGAEPEYMDIRMHGKAHLAGAPLITSNEQGVEDIDVVAPAWNGTTATFRFALALLHEVYGTTDLQVGQPEASTDGPFNQELLMWFPTGIAYQVDDAPDGIGDWVAYEPCPDNPKPAPVQPAADESAPAPTPTTSASEEAATDAAEQDVPAWGLLGTVAALGAAILARRR